MTDTAVQIEQRVANLVRARITPALFRRTLALDVAAWEVPDEPVPFAVAVQQPFTPFEAGRAWGRPWGTTWFHITGAVPEDWGGEGTIAQVFVDLGFSSLMPAFQAEGLFLALIGRVEEGAGVEVEA